MARTSLTKPLWQTCCSLQTWANRYEVPLILLALLLLLRLPNFAEPYWYGDEGIYLAIGTGLRQGLRLYRDIVDHKTPIIYWLAMAPTQMWFRLLLVGWMGAATVFFWDALRRLVSVRTAALAGFLFVLLTSLPFLEGNIPNGELFVIGFISLALWLLSRAPAAKTKVSSALQLGAGLAAGLGILTKVPAVLDAGALAALFWFWAAEKRRFSPQAFRPILPFGAGVLIAIVASVLYFAVRGTLSDYLQFGLLYNLRYSQTWQLPLQDPKLLWLLSLPGKAAILLAVYAGLSLLTWWKKIPALLAWSTGWLAAAFFAALLSNRPYPHYLLQVVPPLAISLALFFEPAIGAKLRLRALLPWLATISMMGATLVLLSFRTYPLWEYYQRFWQYSSGRIDRNTFEQQFNPLTVQNRQLATTIVRGSNDRDRIFIWGTNPMLYALAQRAPASRFTVAFHIHDLQAYDSTLSEVRAVKPIYVVIMKNESALPGLIEYLEGNYILVETTPNMILYRRSNGKSQLLLQ